MDERYLLDSLFDAFGLNETDRNINSSYEESREEDYDQMN